MSGPNLAPEEFLHDLLRRTAAVTGRDFFRVLVQRLATTLGVEFSFVAECRPDHRARSCAYWARDHFGDDFEYAVAGTPCELVLQGRTYHVPDDLAKRFPADAAAVEVGARSYLGVPMLDSHGRVIGHVVVFDTKPMPENRPIWETLETFAARAGVELERMRAFEELTRKLQESEERFRDLFDEAPIAYVHEGLDSKFIRANRTALRILGIKPEAAVGTIGKTLVAKTPDNQRRLREAFQSIERGVDTGGVILELRRQDNGQPVWIEWWSRPDPGGAYTRTMFLDITDRVLMEREKARLEAQNKYLQEEIRTEHNFGEIIGNSPALRAVLRQVEQVAPTDSTVLLTGETGTGKELFARAIHSRSGRKTRPLVKVNCGAISAGLVESELFGHVKGAFTGALTNRDGRFKVADGGTIFLDEIGDLPLDTQVKLLRVLQEQEFEPIGSDQTVKVDVRIIAATNRNLEDAIQAGKFRADLLYRLNVFPIHVPPLRERAEDIPLIAAFFVQNIAKKLGKQITQISDDALRWLTSYAWPGNIRELQNVLERAVILATGPVLTLAHHGPVAAAPPSVSLEDTERRHIESILAKTNWVIEGERGAAKQLNLHPNTLRSRMKKLGIQRPDRTEHVA